MRLCGLLLVVLPACAAPLDLRDSAWTVSIEPSNLAVSARLANGQAVSIATAQPDLGPVSNFVRDRDAAHWDLPAKNIKVSVALRGQQLTLRFTTDRPGRFAWPVYGTPDESASYIIPSGEGFLVAPRDPVWQSRVWPRHLDTMEGFSLPLWGVMGRGWTLTYLMENPFDNTFSFRDTGRGLSWGLEHEFKRHWKEKEFGFDILLGGESPIEPARQYRRRLIASGQFVSMKQKIARTPEAEKLLGAPHAYLWGLGALGRIRGIDRFWLGIPGLAGTKGLPEVVQTAKRLGYLVGPYDSYDSIHSPEEKDTWETAQFDRELFEKGAVVGTDGKKAAGFRKKGYWLSSIAARPYVERRVAKTFAEFGFNSFFMDCDASGFFHDNYDPAFQATQADDMRERLSRMQWIVDRYRVPIGSEDGHWFAAPVIHFAHGMMTPVFGFGDERFGDRKSPYFLGGWWPPEGPAIFMKPVPLPEDFRAIYFDPRHRIPLFQAVFHDSVITTHHWSRPSLKFENVAQVNELLELLYNVPPLYHLNPQEWDKHAGRIVRHHKFFGPLHRQTALLPLEDFAWLTPDRLVQRTTFGGAMEMIANFRAEPFRYGQVEIPAQSIAARHLDSGGVEIFK